MTYKQFIQFSSNVDSLLWQMTQVTSHDKYSTIYDGAKNAVVFACCQTRHNNSREIWLQIVRGRWGMAVGSKLKAVVVRRTGGKGGGRKCWPNYQHYSPPNKPSLPTLLAPGSNSPRTTKAADSIISRLPCHHLKPYPKILSMRILKPPARVNCNLHSSHAVTVS